MEYTHPNDCACYECAGPEYRWSQEYGKQLVNNMKYHTFGEPCDNCGKPKSEYKDLGRKGYYVCWWCKKRAAGSPE